jgi:hypothetical protein
MNVKFRKFLQCFDEYAKDELDFPKLGRVLTHVNVPKKVITICTYKMRKKLDT